MIASEVATLRIRSPELNTFLSPALLMPRTSRTLPMNAFSVNRSRSSSLSSVSYRYTSSGPAEYAEPLSGTAAGMSPAYRVLIESLTTPSPFRSVTSSRSSGSSETPPPTTRKH